MNPAQYKQIFEFAKRLLIEKDVNRLLTMAMDMVIEISGAERGWLILFDEENKKIKFQTARNLQKKDIEKRVKIIADKENLQLSDKTIESLYEASEGDCRRVINLLQASASISPSITSELVNTLTSGAQPAEIKIVLEYALSGDFLKAKEKLLDVMLKESISGTSRKNFLPNLIIDFSLKSISNIGTLSG